MDDFASARHHLERLVAQESSGPRNEATTRLHLIDPLLMDCLGWQPEDIVTERHADGVRTDYEIGRPTARIVVEAKREAKTFVLPPGISQRVVELSTLLEDSTVAEAITQVLRYCQDRSIPVGVATNGTQLVAFLASRQDAVPPLQGKALVFTSLKDMVEDFSTLWGSLSRAGVAESTLQRRLGGASGAALPPRKLSSRATEYPGFRQRSELETDLKILGQLFLLDITGEREVSDDFLRSCYISSGALSQYALVSREILRTRYALTEEDLSDVAAVQTKKGITPKLGPAVLSSALSRRPVLLLGDVGVGKTMFIRHLLRVDANDILADAVVLYIDFGEEPALPNDVPSYVSNRLIEQLRDSYDLDIFENSFVRATYNAEVNRFAKSVAGGLKDTDPAAYAQREIEMLEELLADKGEHVRRSLEHVRGTTRRSVVVVLDNVDQRPPDFHEQVFLIGEGIASRWPATVFIALRPSTFRQSKISRSLSGYHSRAFTVYPARTDEVVSRRLAFARDQLLETGRLESFPAGLSLDSGNLLAYIDVLIKAFSNDHALKEMLENLSGGNVRAALDFVNAFVGSGYVSTQRILDVAAAGDVYNIPLHEFVRAIAYGDAEYFDPTNSPISNVLDITENDGREHFLLSSLLLCAEQLGASSGSKGYVEVEQLHYAAASWGYTQEQVGAQLGRAFRGGLLESAEASPTIGSTRVTSVGLYTVRKLLQMFTYIDIVVVDTPIVDTSIRTMINDVWPIMERLDRADLFVNYLDQQWARCSDQGLPLDWPVVEAALRADIAYARRRAEQAERRYADDRY